MGLVTSALDLLGALLVVVAVALFVAVWSVPAALLVAGVLVLFLSWIVDRRGGA